MIENRAIQIFLIILSIFIISAIATQVMATNNRGWIGVGLKDSTEYMGLRKSEGSGSKGPLVVDVIPDGPAYKGGIKPGDTIISINGIQTPTARSVVTSVRAIVPGNTASFTVVRKGRALNLSVGVSDYIHAVKLYKQHCENGNAKVCTILGTMYWKGLGIAKDFGQAGNLYRKGCDGGNALGCTGLGFMYENGHGVAKDHGQAVTFYRKGCDGGNALGCTSLGYMYRKGLGVVKDIERGIELFQKACSMNYEPACKKLDKMNVSRKKEKKSAKDIEIPDDLGEL